MYEEAKPDLFQIRLTEAGITTIRRIVRLTGVVYAMMLFASASILIIQVHILLQNYKYEYLQGLQLFHAKSLPWFSIVVALWNALGVYYFVKFFRTLNRSITANDEGLFNSSFQYAFRNVIIFIGVMFVSIVVDVISIAVVFKLL
jgi:hypothetical protein